MPYQPQTNGQCECFNATLISILGTLPEKAKVTWPEQILTLVHMYNCTRSNATGFSPYFLMYGRHPLLPIDIKYGVHPTDKSFAATHKYVKGLEQRLAWAYEKAREVS